MRNAIQEYDGSYDSGVGCVMRFRSMMRNAIQEYDGSYDSGV